MRAEPFADPGPPIGGGAVTLVLDSATSRLVVGLADATDGRLLAAEGEPSGYRHGQLLLPLVDRVLAACRRAKTDIAGIIVGTGPGAFTGLRVGLATAAGIARALGRSLVGVSTGEAIVAAAAEVAGCAPAAVLLLLPAGPKDRVVVRSGARPVLLPAGHEPELAPETMLVAVDLPGRAPAEALQLGLRASTPERLAAALVRLGRAAPPAATGGTLTVPEPEYVTLPRGLTAVDGQVRLVRV